MLIPWSLTVKVIEFGVMLHAMSLVLVPSATFTSINTSSIVWAHWPQGVGLYTSPDFSSKFAIAFILSKAHLDTWLWFYQLFSGVEFSRDNGERLLLFVSSCLTTMYFTGSTLRPGRPLHVYTSKEPSLLTQTVLRSIQSALS